MLKDPLIRRGLFKNLNQMKFTKNKMDSTVWKKSSFNYFWRILHPWEDAWRSLGSNWVLDSFILLRCWKNEYYGPNLIPSWLNKGKSPVHLCPHTMCSTNRPTSQYPPIWFHITPSNHDWPPSNIPPHLLSRQMGSFSFLNYSLICFGLVVNIDCIRPKQKLEKTDLGYIFWG